MLTIKAVSVMLAGWKEVKFDKKDARKWAFEHAKMESIPAHLFKDDTGEIITIGNVTNDFIATAVHEEAENDLVYFIFSRGRGGLKSALPVRRGTHVVSFCIPISHEAESDVMPYSISMAMTSMP